MANCDTCRANKVCDHNKFGFENCDNYISADVVEVVRCKDCVWYKESEVTNSYYCDWHREYYETYPNDFCSYGERKPPERSDAE